MTGNMLSQFFSVSPSAIPRQKETWRLGDLAVIFFFECKPVSMVPRFGIVEGTQA
jgi:hypothetical protein